jgi:hypothetical protein
MEVAAHTRPRTPSTLAAWFLPHPRPPWHGRGQGFESPKLHHSKLHHCGLTQTLAMRDALEQGGTGTYPPTGGPM